MSTRTMSRIIGDDIHMKAYSRSVGHRLDARLKKIRYERAKRFLQWHAANGHENILFTNKIKGTGTPHKLSRVYCSIS